MVRHRQARSIATLVGALTVAGAFATADAQTTQRGQPRPDSPRIVVVNFRSADDAAGVAAADAVRDRLMRGFNARDLWVIPKKAVNDNLTQSGYPVDEALSQNDAAQLARLLRADEYVDGIVTQAQDGQYKVDARLRLTRNLDLVQPLPTQTVSKPQDAGQAIARAVEEARKQVDDEAACYRLGAEKKYDEAIAAARKGIEEYPQATLARVCMINIMGQQDVAADRMLATAQEILAIDPASRTALRYAYEAQKELGQNEEATNTLLRLLAADPGNATIQNAVVNELALSRRFGLADSVITEALERNPGDPELMRTAFNVYIAAERWKKAADIGEQVVQIDTAFATPTYFVRLASAYENDSQPQKASEAIARGTAKFPQDASLLVSAADMYRGAGQLQQAVAALNKALQVDPKAPNANLTLAQIYADMNQPDSAIAALRAGLAAGDSAQLVAGVAAQIGQRAYTAASQSKAREDYLRAVPFLQFSDETSPSNPVKFVLGVSAYSAAISALQEAQGSKSCELARTAKDMFAIVNRAFPGGGGTVDAATAGQIMTTTQEYAPYADQMIAAFCR
ncbi:MAG TPA: tetratricopeptide repeat protein [Gemmatimonadales bacterium]